VVEAARSSRVAPTSKSNENGVLQIMQNPILL